jgi:hypothetical protein
MNNMDSRHPMDPSGDAVHGASKFGLLLVAAALALGAFFYFTPITQKNTASYNPPPMTTGQAPRTMAPVVDQVRPVPAIPVPPAAATDDPAKHGVDAEVIPSTPKP